jgi:hypothetical protein
MAAALVLPEFEATANYTLNGIYLIRLARSKTDYWDKYLSPLILTGPK